MRIRSLLLALSMIAVLAGCGNGKPIGSPSGPATTTTQPTGVDLSKAAFEDDSSSKKVEVDAIDNNFAAQYVIVKKGTVVTFKNDGRNEHDVVPVVEGSFKGAKTADFEPGTSYKVTFDEAGDFPYYCSLHGTTTKGMTGAIRVVE
jgi:plastocyanin